jgi:hypothetical protein
VSSVLRSGCGNQCIFQHIVGSCFAMLRGGCSGCLVDCEMCCSCFSVLLVAVFRPVLGVLVGVL